MKTTICSQDQIEKSEEGDKLGCWEREIYGLNQLGDDRLTKLGHLLQIVPKMNINNSGVGL